MDLPVSFSLAGVLMSIMEGVQEWYHDLQFYMQPVPHSAVSGAHVQALM